MKADGFCTTNKQAQFECLLISMCKADLFKYEYVAYSQILVTAALWHLSLFAFSLKIAALSLDFFQMPQLQVVCAPSILSLPISISSTLQGRLCSGRYQPCKVHVVSQTPEKTEHALLRLWSGFSLTSSRYSLPFFFYRKVSDSLFHPLPAHYRHALESKLWLEELTYLFHF